MVLFLILCHQALQSMLSDVFSEYEISVLIAITLEKPPNLFYVLFLLSNDLEMQLSRMNVTVL